MKKQSATPVREQNPSAEDTTRLIESMEASIDQLRGRFLDMRDRLEQMAEWHNLDISSMDCETVEEAEESNCP
jgi:hypothetical protein